MAMWLPIQSVLFNLFVSGAFEGQIRHVIATSSIPHDHNLVHSKPPHDYGHMITKTRLETKSIQFSGQY